MRLCSVAGAGRCFALDMDGLLSFMLSCAAGALFFGSSRRGSNARFAALQAPHRARRARVWAWAAVAGAIALRARTAASVPALVLGASVEFMVALTLATLASTFFVSRSIAGATLARSGAGARRTAPAPVAPVASVWKGRAAVAAHALAATAGTLPAAYFCAAVVMRWWPAEAPARFAIAALLAIPLWVLGMCLSFVVRSAAQTWLWCGATGAGLAALVHWLK